MDRFSRSSSGAHDARCEPDDHGCRPFIDRKLEQLAQPKNGVNAPTAGTIREPLIALATPRYGCRMTEPRTVTVPVAVELDEDGVWCVQAQLRPGVGAHGEGETEEAALDDLRAALLGLIEEFGPPRERSSTLAA
jgi:predicted RNase H-like HicB family nuclease